MPPLPHTTPAVLARLAGGLIVSCQAPPDSPLHGPVFMAAMAKAAGEGGAVGLRLNGPDDIRAARAATALPIIGLFKRRAGRSPVEITPTFADAAAVVEAGADLVALDATGRPRPDGMPLPVLIARIREELGVPVLADVAGVDDGLAAEDAGADAVATTLSGYVDPGPAPPEEPDLDLVAALSGRLHVPVVAEGRIRTPGQARAALDRGAYAVVVGTAITNPREVTRWFVRALAGRERTR
ncbi:MAG: N-acetylmannosamine-6-phosphate 2-epimerase [Armatimonadota bacterium]|nr:N-acetylmannosamine-6-phosphate 2-epimerase [Armatimonadota bacterium]MDR7520482.1 N-acetylmannosamine-6-phosphate 2-epimerase [Armatimonadota bacterium]MDR7548938.1 N-acetylmannosamine-6-phosphate 2-epimerase [Armatimonadota bacterium]